MFSPKVRESFCNFCCLTAGIVGAICRNEGVKGVDESSALTCPVFPPAKSPSNPESGTGGASELEIERNRSEVAVALALPSRPRSPRALDDEGEVLGRLDLPVCDEGMTSSVGSCVEPLLLPSINGAGASVFRFLLAEKLRNSGNDSELVRECDGEAGAVREEVFVFVLLDDSKYKFWDDGMPKTDPCLRTCFTRGFRVWGPEGSFVSTRRVAEASPNRFCWGDGFLGPLGRGESARVLRSDGERPSICPLFVFEFKLTRRAL